MLFIIYYSLINVLIKLLELMYINTAYIIYNILPAPSRDYPYNLFVHFSSFIPLIKLITYTPSHINYNGLLCLHHSYFHLMFMNLRLKKGIKEKYFKYLNMLA